jgi:hypothetical protein
VGGLGLVGYLLAFLGTLMAAGDWWYETFITPCFGAACPGIFGEARPTSVLISAFATSAAFAVGWLIFGFLQLPAGIFPRGASILMMLGRSGRTKHDSARRPPLSLTLDRPGSPQVDLREDWHPQPPGTPRPNLLEDFLPRIDARASPAANGALTSHTADAAT